MHPLVGKPWENHHASRLLRPTLAGSFENAESRQTHDVRDPPFRLFPTIRLLVTLGALSFLRNPRANPRLLSAFGSREPSMPQRLEAVSRSSRTRMLSFAVDDVPAAVAEDDRPGPVVHVDLGQDAFDAGLGPRFSDHAVGPRFRRSIGSGPPAPALAARAR